MREGELPEDGGLVWSVPRGELSGWRRSWVSAKSYWVLLPILAIAVALLLLDLLEIGSGFWESNPLVTNIVSEAIVALALIYGVDRVLKARAARLWRPFGVRIAKELDRAANLHETFEEAVLGYCERVFGEYEIPEGRRYPGLILIEALTDPRTWAGPDEAPDLMTRVLEDQERLEDLFSSWANVLIAEPNLASIAARTSELIEANFFAVQAFRELTPGTAAPMPPELLFWGFKHFASVLMGSLIDSQRLAFELKKEVTLYATGQPLAVGPAAMRGD